MPVLTFYADSFSGGAVDDTVFATGGNDTIAGNGGNDFIYAGDGNDIVLGGPGNDSLDGDWDGVGSVPGYGIGADSLDGGDGNDSLFGGPGIDTLVGGTGDDLLYGDLGIGDTTGGAAGDSLDGGDGNDSVYAGAGNDTILGGNGDDYLWGDFPDSLSGGNDSIDGGAGNDTLSGEGGNDTLAGGTGANIMYGDAGDDTYIVTSPDDQIYDDQGTNHVVVAIDGYKAPSGTHFDAPTYINGAQALPYFIDDLYCGTRWGTFGSGTVTLTYCFMTEQGTQYKPADINTFHALTPDQQAVIVSALGAWSAVANIKFVLAADPSTADLRFGANEQAGGSAGYATLPDGSNGYSEIYFNAPHGSTYSSLFDGVVDWVVLHEIGHALGLKHPFDATNTGGTDVLGDGVHGGEDNVVNTLMSYTDRGTVHTLQEFDVAAIQYLYGPKPGTNAGATSYTFGDHWISDASGIDTFSAAAQTLATHIDLNDGRWNWVGPTQATSVLAANQSFINFNTFIEKAIGGSGNDTIIGNELANTLTGNGGDDSMSGGAGNDTFTGSAGNDTMAGGTGDDVYKAAKGDVIIEAVGEGADRVESSSNWVLGANIEDLTLTGAAKTGTGNDLANHIVGDAAANTLNGGNGDDTIDGGTGADKLSGGAGNDTFVWDPADTFDLGAAGTDTLVLGGSQSLDLTLLDNSAITGMERITLGGTNSLTLAGSDLTALSTTTDTLYVDGDAGDNVYLSGAWTHNANPVAGYDIWKSGLAVLRVDSDIHVSLLGA